MSWVTTEICWYFHYSCCSKHLTSHACALLIDNVGNYLYIYLNNGSFKSEVDPHQFNLRERKKIFKSWQVCDWLAKWLIVLGFMDLRWPRVYRRSNVGLVDYVPIIVLSWHFQELLPLTKVKSMQKVKVKGQGHRGHNTQLNRFRTVNPVWIHIWGWNDAYSLMLLRRGALLFFKVICQISRSHGSKDCRIWPRLGVSGL